MSLKKYTITAYVDSESVNMHKIEFSKEFNKLDSLEKADLLQDFSYLAKLEYENSKDEFENYLKNISS